MIIVPVAQHESVEFGRIDAEQFDIGVDRFRREAEIHECVPRLGAAPSLHVHRQAELADQGPARRLTRADAPAEALDLDVADLRTGSNSELVTVNDHAYRKAIDLGNCPSDTCCPDRSRAAEQRTEHRAERGQPAATNDIASVY